MAGLPNVWSMPRNRYSEASVMFPVTGEGAGAACCACAFTDAVAAVASAIGTTNLRLDALPEVDEEIAARQLASPMPRRNPCALNGFPRRTSLTAPYWCARRGARTRAVRSARWYLARMSDRHLFDDLSERINEALRNSPAADIEKNLRALLADWFGRMDLVMRQDFEVQKKLLEQALARLATLEGRVAELERRANNVDPR